MVSAKLPQARLQHILEQIDGIVAATQGLAFVQPWIAIALYIAVALLWFVPDRRIEKII